MPSQPVRGTIHASHHNFILIEASADGPTRSRADRSNGLVDVQPGGVALIFTGVHTGEVNVTVEVRDEAPPVNTELWDEVVEVSMFAPEGDVGVSGPASETETQHLYPTLTPQGPGDYRIRIHARGRDTEGAPDAGDAGGEAAGEEFSEEEPEEEFGEGEEPNEDYLIIVWPAPEASTTIHKQTDRYGAGLRAR